jgi:hypothetical protein
MKRKTKKPMTTTTQSRVIAATYFYRSSNGETVYQTLEYNDRSTSCDCNGWTRRVAPDGSRSCKHTRLVEAGLGESTAEKVARRNVIMGPSTTQRTPPVKRIGTGERAFDFTKE